MSVRLGITLEVSTFVSKLYDPLLGKLRGQTKNNRFVLLEIKRFLPDEHYLKLFEEVRKQPHYTILQQRLFLNTLLEN